MWGARQLRLVTCGLAPAWRTAGGATPCFSSSGSSGSSSDPAAYRYSFDYPRPRPAPRDGQSEEKSFSVVHVGRHGEVAERTVERATLKRELRVSSSDLRSVDASFRSLPSILTRDDCLVVNLEFVRAVISHKEAYLMEPWHPGLHSQFLPRLRARLERLLNEPPPDARRYKCYEFVVLEQTMRMVVDILERRLETLLLSVRPLLDKAVHDADYHVFTGLPTIKLQLVSFEMVVTEIAEAIRELLGSDEDMAQAYVSVRALTGHSRRVEEHQEFELLLENYLKQVEEIQNEVKKIREDISTTEDIANIELSRRRNEIMKADLRLQYATMSATLGALGAGIFGMNLTSHLEAHPSAFYMTAGALGVISTVTYLRLVKNARKKRIL